MIALVGALAFWPVDEKPGLSQQQIALVADVDGRLPVTTVQMNTASETDPWVGGTTIPWLEAAPTHGTGTQQITLRVKPGVLNPGEYSGIVFVRAANLPETSRSLKVTFSLHAARGVSVYVGDQQVLVINNQMVEPFEVQVRDTLGIPLADVSVSFETVVGVTRPTHLTLKTDSEGRARFQPIPLQYGAVQITARADIVDDSPAYFKAVTTGWASNFAGDGIQAYGGDEGPAIQANLNAPFGMALWEDDLAEGELDALVTFLGTLTGQADREYIATAD